MIKNIVIGFLIIISIMAVFDDFTKTDQIKTLDKEIEICEWQINRLSRHNDEILSKIKKDSLNITKKDSLIGLLNKDLITIKTKRHETTNNYLNDSLNNRIRKFAKLASDR